MTNTKDFKVKNSDKAKIKKDPNTNVIRKGSDGKELKPNSHKN